MDVHHAPDSAPIMLDDSVGALTKSVYDASMTTDRSLAKLHVDLEKLMRKTSAFSSSLINQERAFVSALNRSESGLHHALLQSKRLVNGMSDKEASLLLSKMTAQLLQASKWVINAIEGKNLLRVSLESQSREIAGIAKSIKATTQKSFAVLSVASKICENAKVLQELSKSAVDRAERVHLAKAAEAFKEGVSTINKMLAIENKFIPYKIGNPREILPQAIGERLEHAFTHSMRALNHTENALHMSAGARAREVVDVRDQIRSAIDSEKDAVGVAKSITTARVNSTIVPENGKINLLITGQLIPAMKSYHAINDKILGIVDPSRARDIQDRLSHQVATQSGIIFLPIETLARRSILSSFF